MADKKGRLSDDPRHYQPSRMNRQHGKHRHVSNNSLTRSRRTQVHPKVKEGL